MRLFAASFLLSLLLPVVALAHDGSFVDPAAFLIVEEEDASPSCSGTMLKVTNATLVDNGDGTCSISTGGTATTGWTDDGASVSLTTDTDNVSIGTDTAGGKLFIDGDTDEIQLQVQCNATQTTNCLEVETSGAVNLLTLSGSGTTTFQNSADSTNGFQVLDANGGTPILMVDTSGEQVAIGASDPGTAKLLVVDTTTGTIRAGNTAASSSGQGGGLTLYHDDGAAMGSGDRLALLSMSGAEDASNTLSIGASWEALTTEAWTGSANGTEMIFSTTATGASSRVERMRIGPGATVAFGNSPVDPPSYLISLTGELVNTIGMEREQTAATAGKNLTVSAGGAVSGGTNLNGGDTIIAGATATGNGESKIQFSAVNSGQGTGTTDRTVAVVAQFDEGHLEFFDAVPAVSSCGTSPSINAASTDHAGKVTAGTVAAVTCTITFSVPAYTNAPACFCSNETTEQTLKCVSTTTTLVISSATDFAGDVIAYGCMAFE